MKKEDVSVLMHSFKSLVTVLAPVGGIALIGDPIYGSMAGNLFLQALFQIQGDVKRARVNMFLEKLESGISSIDPNFDIEKVDKIELCDLVETAILKASKANTTEKIERLKQIIVGQVIHSEPYDYVRRYLSLASNLNEKQIVILSKYVSTEIEFIEIQDDVTKLNQKPGEAKLYMASTAELGRMAVAKSVDAKMKFDKIESEILDRTNDYNQIRRVRNEQFKILGENEFNFMLNDLRVLGLIHNPAEGRASNTGQYADYRCTGLAMGFIKFLENN